MSDYGKIPWSPSISAGFNRILQRARAVASSAAAQLHIIHVIEPSALLYGGDIPTDFSGIQTKSTSRPPSSWIVSPRATGSTRLIATSSWVGRRWKFTPRRRTPGGPDCRRQSRPPRPRPADGLHRQWRTARRQTGTYWRCGRDPRTSPVQTPCSSAGLKGQPSSRPAGSCNTGIRTP